MIGRRMYDESQPWWHGSGPLGDIPCFVLTKKGSEPQEAAEMFAFVTEGIEKALELAKAAAGGKELLINGGANTIQRYLKAGLVDVINIHLVPILLGSGTSLFGQLGKRIELEKVSVTDEPDATHLAYRVKK
jgi:dihydrofolate reductase